MRRWVHRPVAADPTNDNVTADPLEVGPAAIWFDAHALHAWTGNYMRHPQAQLDEIKASIARNGWGSPAVAQMGTHRLIIGHGRVAAYLQLMEAGETFAALAEFEPLEQALLARGLIPVRMRSLPDDRAAELAIADNESARMGVRDDAALGRAIKSFADSRAGLVPRALGMPAAELERIKRRAGIVKDPRNVKLPLPGKPPDVPVSESGTVYHLGKHRLLVGDSHDADLLALLMGAERADAVIQDPPFAIYGSSSGLSSDVTDDAIVRPFFAAMWRSAQRVSRHFAHVYVNCDWRSYASLWDTMKGTGLQPANCLIWDKGQQGLGSKWPNTHEFVLFAEHLPEQKTMRGSVKGSKTVSKSNILRHSRPRGEQRKHNAAKPPAMIADIVEASTDRGELIADLYAGSGTVLLVCAQFDRRCYCAEKSPAWADVIRRRWTTWADEAGIDAGSGALR